MSERASPAQPAIRENHRPILFVPVSSPVGMGEYMRSLYIATAVQQRWPAADVHFIVSREAPYADRVPFTTHQTPTSPTKHIAEVNRIVSMLRPDVVVFDCSGRVAQLRHARRLGSTTVFVSQHRHKRRRGFRLSRMRHTDVHWIVQPAFVDGDLTWWERTKLRAIGRPRVSFIGPVFPPPEPPQLTLPDPPYFLCCAGTGGVRLGGQSSAELFAAQAAEVAQATGMLGVMVMGPGYDGELTSLPGLLVVPRLSGAELAHVLACAELALLAGGDTLGQAAALGVPTVAAPIGKDQSARIRAYEREGLCLAAEPDQLARVTIERLTEGERTRQRHRMKEVGLRNGLHVALEQLAELMSARR